MPQCAMMVNRILKRVPLDFDWPRGEIWPGYMFSICGEIENYFPKMEHDERCNLCKKFATIMGWKIQDYGCPTVETLEPPMGKGYQCWETTTEGSPMSPVFKTLDELCEWLVGNTGGTSKDFTKESWLKILKEEAIAVDIHTKELV